MLGVVKEALGRKKDLILREEGFDICAHWNDRAYANGMYHYDFQITLFKILSED